MITRVLFDLDDVLNSFTLPTLQWFGCDVGPYDYHIFPDVGYDIVAAYNKLKPDDRPEYTTEEFWQLVGRGVWANAPKSREFDDLLGLAEAIVGRENIGIVTAPTDCPESLAGKLVWIQRHMPPWMHKQFMVGHPKEWCANKHTLLIDDREENCRRFQEAGGNAYLLPRPWNSKRGIDTSEELNRFRHALVTRQQPWLQERNLSRYFSLLCW